MTDKTPANLTRKETQAVREWAERAWHTKVQDAVVANAARVLLAVLPKPPTLADMAPEARRDCQWMQADTKPWGRVVIVAPDLSGERAALLDVWGDVAYEDHASITPLPDLPRMEWPSVRKPAPALPDGWRLADHKDHGRVIVTNPTPNSAGNVYFVLPANGIMGHDWFFCDPDELTYLDQ